VHAVAVTVVSPVLVYFGGVEIGNDVVSRSEAADGRRLGILDCECEAQAEDMIDW